MLPIAYISQYVWGLFTAGAGDNSLQNAAADPEALRNESSPSEQRSDEDISQTSQNLQRSSYSEEAINKGSDLKSTNIPSDGSHTESSFIGSITTDNVSSIDTKTLPANQAVNLAANQAATVEEAPVEEAPVEEAPGIVQSKLTKAPNILIYTGKESASSPFTGIRDVLLKCVGPTSYTIYHLKHGRVLSASPWQENCRLLVIASEQLYDGIEKAFIQYFSSGGKILSLCSNLDNTLCSLQLNDNPNTIQVVQTKHKGSIVNLVQGRYHYTNLDCLLPHVQLSPLDNTTAGRIVVIEARNPQRGRCVLTQVHLVGQTEQTIDPEMLSLLTESEPLRQRMVGDFLQMLDIELYEGSAGDCRVTTCYIRSASGQEMLREFIQRVHEDHPNHIKDKVLSVEKVGDFALSEEACSEEVPLGTFNWKTYKEHLTSKDLGQILLYQRVALTTMNIVKPFLFCSPSQGDVVAMASRQLAGIGRGANAWLSPQGCLAMTLNMKLNMNSTLGQRPSLVQTVPAVAVSRLMDLHLQKHVEGTAEIQVNVKWPNDIYYDGVKMGGVLIHPTTRHDTIHASVGVGVNVLNAKPTLNLNDVIRNYNAIHDTNVPGVSIEFMAARICSEIEFLVDLINENQAEYMDIYYKYWLHEGVRVDMPQQNVTNGLIVGLDERGFLEIRTDDGSTFHVQPEGNSFDMIRNVIKVKE